MWRRTAPGPVRDVLGNGEVLERYPAGEDHVHDHQGPVVRRVDEDVVRSVVRPVVVKEQPFSAQLQDVMVVERDSRRRPVRVIIAQQHAAAFAVSRLCPMVGGASARTTSFQGSSPDSARTILIGWPSGSRIV